MLAASSSPSAFDVLRLFFMPPCWRRAMLPRVCRERDATRVDAATRHDDAIIRHAAYYVPDAGDVTILCASDAARNITMLRRGGVLRCARNMMSR